MIDRRGRVLIAQRPPGKHLAGGWEFPGGKLEPGEARAEALARELREEIGIAISEPRPLLRLRHVYPYGEVLLDVWVVRRYRGTPRGLDGQPLRWLRRSELLLASAASLLLPADRPIVATLKLPQHLRQLATRDYHVGDVHSLTGPAAVDELRCSPKLCGVFCTDIADAARAVTNGADFLVLREALADDDLRALCDAVPVPVFARHRTLERAWALGASGIASIVG